MEEQEISLRELIEILLNNKMIIASITIFCMLVSGALSFFVLDPVYESEAKILVSDLNIKTADQEGIKDIIDSASTYPSFNVESYKEQIKNPEILAKVIEELSLDPEKYSIRSLAKAVNIENTKNTNILKIKVKNKDAKLAADIANSLANNFSSFISQLARKQADKSLEYVEKQLAVEEENLNKVLLSYKKFLQQPQGVSEMESEQKSKISMLTDYKQQLSQIDLDIAIYQANLKEAEQQLVKTEPYIVTNKSLADDSLMLNYVEKEKGKNIGDVAGLQMKSEEVNPLYQSLQNTISSTKLNLAQVLAKKENLQIKITQTQKELENIQVALADRKHQQEIINRQVENARKKYNALVDKSEEVRLAQSSKVGDAAIVVSSKAYPSTTPVSPRKALNVAIALVLGLMVGTFIAFFKEYWQATGKE